jgi:hypothetical protein
MNDDLFCKLDECPHIIKIIPDGYPSPSQALPRLRGIPGRKVEEAREVLRAQERKDEEIWGIVLSKFCPRD